MTLTEITYYIRKSVPFVIIGLIFFIIFFILIRVLLSSLQSKQAEPVQTLNPCFGKITKISPSTKIEYPPNVTFTIDNIAGRPTTATTSADVYSLPKDATRFGYLQNIYLMAKSLGFDTEIIGHRSEDTKAIFQDINQKFVVDISSFNFEYKYNYEGEQELFDEPFIPDETQIKEDAKQFLRLLGAYHEELARGRENIIYLRFDPSTLEFEVVETVDRANAVEIDFFRPDINEFPAVSPKFFNSQHFVVMIFKEDGHKVIKSQVQFFPKDEQQVCPYPVKTGDLAWQELQEGIGIIVSAGDNGQNITVKKMFLGYYDPDVSQEFLQPVYVFLGDNSFAAYVPAVSAEFTE